MYRALCDRLPRDLIEIAADYAYENGAAAAQYNKFRAVLELTYFARLHMPITAFKRLPDTIQVVAAMALSNSGLNHAARISRATGRDIFRFTGRYDYDVFDMTNYGCCVICSNPLYLTNMARINTTCGEMFMHDICQRLAFCVYDMIVNSKEHTYAAMSELFWWPTNAYHQERIARDAANTGRYTT